MEYIGIVVMSAVIPILVVTILGQRGGFRSKSELAQSMMARYMVEILKGQGKDPKTIPLPEEVRRHFALELSRGREPKVLEAIERIMGLDRQDASHVVMFQVRRVDIDDIKNEAST